MKSIIGNILVASLLCAPVSATAAEVKLSGSVRKIVRHIQTVDRVVLRWNTEGGSPKEEEDFRQLRRRAATAELMALAEYPDVRVRCYAYWALACDSTVDLLPTVVAHLSDTSRALVMSVDCGYWTKAADFFILLVTGGGYGYSRKLNAAETRRLDSILIYTDNNLDATTRALLRAKPEEWAYPRIRELAAVRSYGPALVALAKYRREQDTSVIIRQLTDTDFAEGSKSFAWQAICEYPHPTFLQVLGRCLSSTFNDKYVSNDWRDLYAAIAMYENNEAVRLLTTPFTAKLGNEDYRSSHIQYIYEILRKHEKPVFNDLLWKLWSEKEQIGPDIFDYLAGESTDRALELSRRDVERPYEIYLANLGRADFGETEATIGKMLDLVLDYDQHFGFETIRKQLLVAEVGMFPQYLERAMKIKDSPFVQPLVRRLNIEDNPNVYLKAAVALLAYGDTSLCQRVLNSTQTNDELRHGWGGDSLKIILHNWRKAHFESRLTK